MWYAFINSLVVSVLSMPLLAVAAELPGIDAHIL